MACRKTDETAVLCRCLHSTTLQERWEFRRHGLRTQHVASGMIKSLDDDNRYWKEYYHELVVDDKLLQSDLEQFMRSLQYTGDQGWRSV